MVLKRYAFFILAPVSVVFTLSCASKSSLKRDLNPFEADVWRNARGSENVMLSFSHTYFLFFIEISLPFKFSYSHCQTFPTDNGFDICYPLPHKEKIPDFRVDVAAIRTSLSRSAHKNRQLSEKWAILKGIGEVDFFKTSSFSSSYFK